MYRKTAKKLLKFIEKSPTAFQAVTEMTKRLDKEGFEELKEEDHWKLKKGGNYYVTRNHSAIIAFSIPQKPVWKFHIMASHSDSPSLKDATEKVVSLVSQGVEYVQKCSLIIKYC